MKRISTLIPLVVAASVFVALPASSASAKTGFAGDFRILCYYTGQCDEQSWTQNVLTDLESTATITAASTNCGAASFRLRIFYSDTPGGGIPYQATSSPLAPGQSQQLTLAGTTPFGWRTIKIDVPGGLACGSASDDLKGTLTINPVETGPKLQLDGVDPNNVKTSRSVTFKGSGWDRAGKQIVVKWGKRTVARIQPAESFSRRFVLADFQTKTINSCSGTLIAKQGSSVRKIELKGTPDHYYYFATGIQYADGEPVHSGSFVCAGIKPRSTKTAAFIKKPKLNPGDPSAVGLIVYSRPKKVYINGVFFNRSGSGIGLGLAGGGKATAKTSLHSSIGPVLAKDLTDYDPILTDRAGYATLPAEVSDKTVEFNARRNGNLKVTGVLKLRGGVLYVKGNLTVRGGLKGSGTIVVIGKIQISGPVDFREANLVSLVSSDSLFIAGKR